MNATHIRDLSDGITDVAVDVCILGAGAAGIYLASRLSQSRVSVALLEAGDSSCVDSKGIGMAAKMTQDNYSGATLGRAFGLGGTTSLWGGQLVPHTSVDIQQQLHGGFDPWAHIVDVTNRYSVAVKDALGITNGESSDVIVDRALGRNRALLSSCGIIFMASEFLPFRRKNFKFLLDRLPKGAGTQIFLGTVADSYLFDTATSGDSRLTSVRAVDGEKELKVTARSFVIAAGTIEATRILLEMNSRNGHEIIRKGAMVGNYLSDHLSVSVAKVGSSSLPLATRLFAPRFNRGRMRSFRFFENIGTTGSSRYFSHFIFDNGNPGFKLARKILGAIQSREKPVVTAVEIISGISGLIGLAWNRLARSRLHIPSGTAVHLQLDLEQAPDSENRITLGRELDSHGRRVVEINWKISQSDYANIKATAARILTIWPGSKAGLPELEALDDVGIGLKPHDAYHPVGTCRMGEGMESVVSLNLKVHGTSNVYVLSTAVFPTAGSANPTFGMLCFAERLAESLSSELQAST